jgi:hypothetical protein
MSSAYDALDDEGKQKVRCVADAVIEAANEYADMMERGEIEMCSGPDALRMFGATINVALILKDDPR